LAKLAVFPHGRPSLCNGRLERGNRHGLCAGRPGCPDSLERTQQNCRQKKARLGSRADKGLEIFFGNEKVCFEKQKGQYIPEFSDDLPHNRQSSIALTTTIGIVLTFRVVFLHRLM
jgi:hypothetical protein